LDAKEQEDKDHIEDEDANFKIEHGDTNDSSVMKHV
jgi:hypothetical protein